MISVFPFSLRLSGVSRSPLDGGAGKVGIKKKPLSGRMLFPEKNAKVTRKNGMGVICFHHYGAIGRFTVQLSIRIGIHPSLFEGNGIFSENGLSVRVKVRVCFFCYCFCRLLSRSWARHKRYFQNTGVGRDRVRNVPQKNGRTPCWSNSFSRVQN